MNIVIISVGKSHKTKRLRQEAEARRHHVEVYDPHKMMFEIGDKVKMLNRKSRRKIHACIFLTQKTGREIVAWAKSLEQQYGTKFFFNDFDDQTLLERSSLGVQLKAQRARISVPKTYFAGSDARLKEVKALFDFPFFVKRTFSSRKKAVALVKGNWSLRRAWRKMSKYGRYVMVREFIPHSREWRVVLLDKKPIAIMERHSEPGRFLSGFLKTAIRIGREPKEVPEVVKLAKQTAKGMDLEYCGLDIIEHEQTGELYVIDFNPLAMFKKTEQITGVNVAKEMVKYIENNAK